MTPIEQKDLQRDVEGAHKLLQNAFGRKLSDREVAERFTRLERRLCRTTLSRVETGVSWSLIDSRCLRAVQRSGHHYAALLAAIAGIDLSDHKSEIDFIARDDDRLADKIRSVRIEFALWNRTQNPNADGIDVDSICISYAAASIRARIELNLRNGEEPLGHFECTDRLH